MPLRVETNDAISLTDADLDEMGSIEGAFDIGVISKSKDQWVLVTTARTSEALDGFMFSTLERIGGTPCVLIGMLSVRRNADRLQTMRGLMDEAFHRALMAFPDEDVVVASRFVHPGALMAFSELDEVVPHAVNEAVGEERAWGRRLAKRFGVDKEYDAKTFRSQHRQMGYFDFEPDGGHEVDEAVATQFVPVVDDTNVALIVYGWTMAEQLAELGKK